MNNMSIHIRYRNEQWVIHSGDLDMINEVQAIASVFQQLSGFADMVFCDEKDIEWEVKYNDNIVITSEYCKAKNNYDWLYNIQISAYVIIRSVYCNEISQYYIYIQAHNIKDNLEEFSNIVKNMFSIIVN